MGSEALAVNMIGETSHETPAGVRSQSGGGPSSTCVSECDLQSNDTVEYFSLQVGELLSYSQMCFQADEEELPSIHLPQESPTRKWEEARGGGRCPS